MIHTHSTLIRAGRGRVRVLRLTCAHGRVWPLRYTVEPGESFCRLCGCIEELGCAGGCGWVDKQKTLCSRCFEKELLP